ncbi:MAG: hypothetical protein R2845_09505 [Thermomicrobiales bacterium]
MDRFAFDFGKIRDGQIGAMINLTIDCEHRVACEDPGVVWGSVNRATRESIRHRGNPSHDRDSGLA